MKIFYYQILLKQPNYIHKHSHNNNPYNYTHNNHYEIDLVLLNQIKKEIMTQII